MYTEEFDIFHIPDFEQATTDDLIRHDILTGGDLIASCDTYRCFPEDVLFDRAYERRAVREWKEDFELCRYCYKLTRWFYPDFYNDEDDGTHIEDREGNILADDDFYST